MQSPMEYRSLPRYFGKGHWCLLVLLSLLLLPNTLYAQYERPRSINLLFLGDDSEHEPAARATLLAQIFGPQGIYLTYADDPGVLNSETLASYDALMIFSAWPELSPQQEEALQQFLAAGKGLIGLHIASGSFANSPDFTRMLGGRYRSHHDRSSVSYRTELQHPAVVDVGPIETDSIAFIHTALANDNQVLMARTENRQVEPVTWVRTHNGGRVFYSSYGHNEATWQLPAFQTMLRQAVLWSVGQDVVNAWAVPGRPPLLYSDPDPPLPNYEQRPAPLRLQDPLPPTSSMDHMQLPEGFEIQLFASEPDIVNPVAMTWDEWGRLWVAESVDYPNDKQPLGQGGDRIKILEDTDADGRADAVTVFAENLSIPTGIVLVNGGVLVAAAPEMLFLKDTDFDDVADEQEVLFDGLKVFDTHAGPSNLRYGLDNWIWGAIGYAGFEGNINGTHHAFKQGVFRFQPDGSGIEHLTRLSNNSWGMGLSEEGDVFASTANNQHSVYVAIPDRYLNLVNGFDQSGNRGIAPYKQFHPITPNIRQYDVHGGYTAAAGHALYTARSFPLEYWNRTAFIAEPTGHLVHQAFLENEGSNFVARDGWNILASADEWFAPIQAEVGPDGALWVLDWYNPIIQHNPYPEGSVGGAGDAYVTNLRDKAHGRIYRITHRDAPAYRPLRLSINDENGLLQALRHENMFWRVTAQRLLVERGQTDVVQDLIPFVQDDWMDEVGVNGGAQHAIWVLHGLGALDGSNATAYAAVRDALGHPASGVRRAALKVMQRTPDLWTAIEEKNLLNDPDPRVVLETLKAVAELPADHTIGQTLYELQKSGNFEDDAWLPSALAIAASQHAAGYLAMLISDPEPELVHDTRDVLILNGGFELGGAGAPDGWSVETYTWPPDETNPNAFIIRTDLNGRSGRSLQINSTNGADVGVYTTVPVTPNQNYLLKGWVKTRDLINVGGGYGALLTIPGVGRARAIRGTTDWTQVEIAFNSGDRTEVRVQCHLGRWGQYKGTAWFDDLTLTELGDVSLPARVAETTLRHLGQGAPGADALSIIYKLTEAHPDAQRLVLETFAKSWTPDAPPALDDDDDILLYALRGQLDPDAVPALDALRSRWREGLYAGEGETGPPAQLVTLRAEAGTLKFDLSRFTVKTGQRIQLTLENRDAMPHNAVFGVEGTLMRLGELADEMATSSDGLERQYIPAGDEVWFATDLVDPGETMTFTFEAPMTTGVYPFVCTFPGHWRTMNGVMIVEP